MQWISSKAVQPPQSTKERRATLPLWAAITPSMAPQPMLPSKCIDPSRFKRAKMKSYYLRKGAFSPVSLVREDSSISNSFFWVFIGY